LRHLQEGERKKEQSVSQCEGAWEREERKAHESLDLPGSFDGQLVLLTQLIHTKNGNDILERLVVLEDLLDLGGDLCRKETKRRKEKSASSERRTTTRKEERDEP